LRSSTTSGLSDSPGSVAPSCFDAVSGAVALVGAETPGVVSEADLCIGGRGGRLIPDSCFDVRSGEEVEEDDVPFGTRL
jgi:hypothetical protein